MSSSPVVKKATASKVSRFLALRSSFFLVTSWQSVRMTVSHRPLSWPSFHRVAAAFEMDSCCHPLLSPMKRSLFFGLLGGERDRQDERGEKNRCEA